MSLLSTFFRRGEEKSAKFQVFDSLHYISAAQQVKVIEYFFGGPVPPFELLQKIYCLVVKPLADDARGVAARYVIGGHVFRYHGICAYNCAVTYVHAGQNSYVLTYPHVVSDNRIALYG